MASSENESAEVLPSRRHEWESETRIKLPWASQEEAQRGLLLLARLRLAHACSMIVVECKHILREEEQRSLCELIPEQYMSRIYKRGRDLILRSPHSPRELLERTDPFVRFKHDLQEAVYLNSLVAAEFRGVALKDFVEDGGKVTVNNPEEMHIVMDEIDSCPDINPTVIIKADLRNQTLVQGAIEFGFNVVLY